MPLALLASAGCCLLSACCVWCALACEDYELLIYAGLLVVGVVAIYAPQARLPRVKRPLARSAPVVAPHKAAA